MPKTSEKTLPKPVAVKAPAKGDHVFLVDGSSYIFRAYHALPPLNRNSDGLQVNAVLGFCNMLWKLLQDMKPEERPTHLAVIFDKSERTFRNEFYPAYKAHRPDAPDDLVPQFKYIREAVRAFDIPCLEQQGYEADDLIATYARIACEAGASTTIVSSDKDLMPLAELAVHEPDYRRLIAFLKAMEFTTLTRRVADAGGIDPGNIDPDPRLRAESAFAPAAEERGTAPAPPGGLFARTGAPTRAPAGRGKEEFAASPQALAGACAEAARNTKVDRSQYET